MATAPSEYIEQIELGVNDQNKDKFVEKRLAFIGWGYI